jgi:cyclopropane fatty-acyl-phospholipid synthase-like methyltransferase
MEARQYAPAVFDRNTLEEAKHIILTPEAGMSTEERWETETEWLLTRLRLPAGVVIDFGCGIGRLARGLVQDPTYTVIGVDISASMREQALAYVDSPEFVSISPHMFAALVASGMQVPSVIAVWALQHTVQPEMDIDTIGRALRPGGTLVVLNRRERIVPVTDSAGNFGWIDDGVDIHAMLRVKFTLREWIEPPAEVCLHGSYLTRWERR